jgi:hypothetical protein
MLAENTVTASLPVEGLDLHVRSELKEDLAGGGPGHWSGPAEDLAGGIQSNTQLGLLGTAGLAVTIDGGRSLRKR